MIRGDALAAARAALDYVHAAQSLICRGGGWSAGAAFATAAAARGTLEQLVGMLETIQREAMPRREPAQEKHREPAQGKADWRAALHRTCDHTNPPVVLYGSRWKCARCGAEGDNGVKP